MNDQDDEIIMKDKNDILNEELGIHNDHSEENDTSIIGQFDIFSKIYSHNQKCNDRQKNVVLPDEDQIEFIDENLV